MPAVYRNPVPGVHAKRGRWFTPFAPDDPEGKVRVPTHMVLLAGFEMEVAVAVVGRQRVAVNERSDEEGGSGLSSRERKPLMSALHEHSFRREIKSGKVSFPTPPPLKPRTSQQTHPAQR